MFKKYVVFVFLGVIPNLTIAQTLEANQYAVWGIGEDEIAIPTGSIITEAVLTIRDITPNDNSVNVYLLDNTLKGFTIGTDNGGSNLNLYGIPVAGTAQNTSKVFRFSQINDAQSHVWQTFSNPCIIQMADASTVQLSSSLLEMIDYAGNGGGFGIGIISGVNKVQFSNIELSVTYQAYQTEGTNKILSFQLVPSLLVNADFESGDTGWVKFPGFSIMNDSSKAYAGSYCAQFNTPANSTRTNFAVYQEIQTSPQTTYTISAMVCNNHKKDMRFVVFMLDGSDNIISQYTTNSVTSTSYQKTSGKFTVPTGCTKLRIMMYIHDIGLNDETIAYVDNCDLQRQ